MAQGRDSVSAPAPQAGAQAAVGERPVLAISQCLMGDAVRFNGGHKLMRLCRDRLGEYFDFIKICPEVGIGLGTPRQPIRLIGEPNDYRARGTVDASQDYSAALATYADQQAQQWPHISGYILMSKSPSCGLFRVKLYGDNGHPNGHGQGIYAKTFSQLRPELPMEESGRLCDAHLLENFITRVYAYHAWQRQVLAKPSVKALVQYHSQQKYLLMAHHVETYKQLGRLVAQTNRDNLDQSLQQYLSQFMQALGKPASRKTHTNVLMHLQGYLKKYLNSSARVALRQTIDEYRRGLIPIVVPINLLQHYFKQYPQQTHYALQQSYLNPHPFELGLRNPL